MSIVSLGGNPAHTSGELPAVGTEAPNFSLVKGDLSLISNSDLAGKKVVLNIFPSVDTPTCATSVRKFNAAASTLENTVVLCVSADLPFAQGRFCGAEGLSNVVTASSFRSPAFGADFGVTLTDTVLQGLLARAVVVLDESGKIVHTELVSEIAHEPNYDAALDALK
jgi:thioredoxin-dependent peroxiredoxin